MARRGYLPTMYPLFLLLPTIALIGCRTQTLEVNKLPTKTQVKPFHATKLYPVKRGEKMGFIDAKGKMAIEPQWDLAFGFHDGLAAVETFSGEGQQFTRSRSYIDEKGKVVLRNVPSPEPTDAVATGGRIPFEKGNRVGFLDRNGKVVISAKYFCEIAKGDCGCSCEDGAVGSFEGEVAWARTGHDEILIDKFGKQVYVGLNFMQYLALKNEGVTSFKDHGLFGYKDANGKVIIPAKFSSAGEFHDGFAWVEYPKEKDRFIYIDKQGRQLGDEVFTFAHDFSEGLGTAKIEDEYVIVSKNGKIIPLPPRTNPNGGFAHGLLMATISTSPPGSSSYNHEEVFIDRQGKVVARFSPSQIEKGLYGQRIETPFDGTLAQIYSQDEMKSWWVTGTGHVVWEEERVPRLKM